jgi:hypothetical protein
MFGSLINSHRSLHGQFTVNYAQFRSYLGRFKSKYIINSGIFLFIVLKRDDYEKLKQNASEISFAMENWWERLSG